MGERYRKAESRQEKNITSRKINMRALPYKSRFFGTVFAYCAFDSAL